MKIVIVGTGRMAREVDVAASYAGDEVLSLVGEFENPDGVALTPERLAGAEVVIEFTTPQSVVANLRALAAAHATVVCGTTGWDQHREEVEQLFRESGGALLAASNFSLGMHLMLRVARTMAEGSRGWAAFDAFIHERHHAAKKDMPSGTAIALQKAVHLGDPTRECPITAVRAGSIPGEHELTLDGPFESLTLRHVARDRRVFATGALAAGRWLRGRKGVFTLDDLVDDR